MANNIVETAISVATNNKISNRPDGLDINRYKDINNWIYRRWAWEFLRRNDSYIEECKRVNEGTDKEKLEVAKKYGLTKFKGYNEHFNKVSFTPRYSIDSISSWENLDNNNQKIKEMLIPIKSGQMLVLFDLASAIKDEKVLDKQLLRAEIRIRKRIAEYEKIIQKKTVVHKHKAAYFGVYIRLLDLLASGKKYDECASIIYPKAVEIALGKEELQQLVKNQIKAARSYAKDKYISLSLLNGKPEGRKILLELELSVQM